MRLFNEIVRLEEELSEALDWGYELLVALRPFSHLAEVMKEGEYLVHRGVYVSWEQAVAAMEAVEKSMPGVSPSVSPSPPDELEGER